MDTVTKTVITNEDGSESLEITIQAPTPAPVQPPTPAPKVITYTEEQLQALFNEQTATIAALQNQQPIDLAAFQATQASDLAAAQAVLADIQDSIDKLTAASNTN